MRRDRDLVGLEASDGEREDQPATQKGDDPGQRREATHEERPAGDSVGIEQMRGAILIAPECLQAEDFERATVGYLFKFKCGHRAKLFFADPPPTLGHAIGIGNEMHSRASYEPCPFCDMTRGLLTSRPTVQA